jgi:hypothetical protein
MKSQHNFWVIKCRGVLATGESGWYWHWYLDREAVSRNKIYPEWGGPKWIKSHLSRKLIRERFKRDDIVVCYQMDGREILGFTRLASDGLEVDGVHCAFDLAPPSTAYRNQTPLTIEELRATGCRPIAFSRKFRGTILELSPGEMQGICAAIIANNPEEENDLLAWLKAAGFGDGSRPQITKLGNAQFKLENQKLDNIDAVLRTFEKKFAGKDDVYVTAMVNAVIRRDGPFINALKQKYNYRCQFPGCRALIRKKSGGYYCEVGHISAVADGGKASILNLLVLCPNHHKAIDYGETEVLVNARTCIKFRLNGEIVNIKRA